MAIKLNTRDIERLGTILKDARIQTGYSQGHVAESMGCAQPFVSEIERDGRSPSVATLIKYLDSIGLELTIDFK